MTDSEPSTANTSQVQSTATSVTSTSTTVTTTPATPVVIASAPSSITSRVGSPVVNSPVDPSQEPKKIGGRIVS